MEVEYETYIKLLEARIAALEEYVKGKTSPKRLDCLSLHPDAQLPAKAGDLEAGWDIRCVSDDYFTPVHMDGAMFETEFKVGEKFFVLYPGKSYTFHTGFAAAVEPGYAMLLWDRSGMAAKKHIHRLAGVIDCTYRGEWLVCLTNLDDKPQVIKAGDKIVQGIYTELTTAIAAWVDKLPLSDRGVAGFGSTGR